MYRFIETLKIEDGIIQNPEYHERRYLKTLHNFYPHLNHADLISKIQTELDLFTEKNTVMNDGFKSPDAVLKCRVIYSGRIELIEFQQYKMKKISSLKKVISNDINYSSKYSDRSCINSLHNLKENCDDILIIKNKYITDTSFANTVFYDGNNYYTPDTPLLPGTKREKLLYSNIIREKRITIDDIKNFEYVSLINAMIDLDEIKIQSNNIY